jgi:hypothetical protein
MSTQASLTMAKASKKEVKFSLFLAEIIAVCGAKRLKRIYICVVNKSKLALH